MPAQAAVAHHLEACDAVFVGAEGVMENGGIINKIGTLTVATCAKAMRKPVYVAAESYVRRADLSSNRGDDAAGTWMFRQGESRRRRGWDVDIQ